MKATMNNEPIRHHLSVSESLAVIVDVGKIGMEFCNVVGMPYQNDVKDNEKNSRKNRNCISLKVKTSENVLEKR